MKKKIECPWAHDNSEEEIKASHTLSYWCLSSSWNGRGPSVRVHEAITDANLILNGISNVSMLYKVTNRLMHDIVEYGSKTAMKRTTKKAANENPKPAKLVLL